MTTTAIQSTSDALSLRERAIAAAAEADAAVAVKRAEDERKQFEPAAASLRERLSKLGITDEIECSWQAHNYGDYEITEVCALVDGLVFSLTNAVYRDSVSVLVECSRGCGTALWKVVDDLEDLGRLIRAPHQHVHACVVQPTDTDPREKAARQSIDALAAAATRCSAALNAIAELEDERALIKPQAIRRLMDSGAASSPTAAEKIVEQDPEYAAHRRRQRDAEVEKWAAAANYEAAKLTATLDVALCRAMGRDE
jgi:hypothetical protein